MVNVVKTESKSRTPILKKSDFFKKGSKNANNLKYSLNNDDIRIRSVLYGFQDVSKQKFFSALNLKPMDCELVKIGKEKCRKRRSACRNNLISSAEQKKTISDPLHLLGHANIENMSSSNSEVCGNTERVETIQTNKKASVNRQKVNVQSKIQSRQITEYFVKTGVSLNSIMAEGTTISVNKGAKLISVDVLTNTILNSRGNTNSSSSSMTQQKCGAKILEDDDCNSAESLKKLQLNHEIDVKMKDVNTMNQADSNNCLGNSLKSLPPSVCDKIDRNSSTPSELKLGSISFSVISSNEPLGKSPLIISTKLPNSVNEIDKDSNIIKNTDHLVEMRNSTHSSNTDVMNINDMINEDATFVEPSIAICDSDILADEHFMVINKTTSEDQASNTSSSKILNSSGNNNKHDIQGEKRIRNSHDLEDNVVSKNKTKASSTSKYQRNPPHCKICLKVFTSYRMLMKHRVEHGGENPYKCRYCSQTYSVLDDLTAHLRSHQGKLPYKCKKCELEFATIEEYKKHEPLHVLRKSSNADKNHICEICLRGFRKISDLERHLRVHTGEKPAVCNICNKRFQRTHNLTKHLLIHIQAKAYECDICGKSFCRSDALNRHSLTHSVSKPHNCPYCEKTFIRVSQCDKHVKKYHPSS